MVLKYFYSMINYRSFFYMALISCTTTFQVSAESKTYRWVDSEGKVYYSDNVPPSKSKLERQVLSDTGRVIGVIQAAKTKEQIALEKRLKTLRKEQEKIIAKQKSNDKVLLSTFRNIDDLRMTLNGKLQAMDAQRRVHERTLENLKEDLVIVRKKAANAERHGRKVSKKMLDEMASIEDKISLTYTDINKTIETKKAIKKKFDNDIERFLFFTKASNVSVQELSDEIAEIKAASTLGLFNCKDKQSCNQAWEVAKQFVIKNSTTPINFNTDSLIMGSDPQQFTDISLSASRSTRANHKVSIFLDIRCHNSTLGQEFCLSEKVENIRHEFRPYIENALKN